jgi:hypothetical protein
VSRELSFGGDDEDQVGWSGRQAEMGRSLLFRRFAGEAPGRCSCCEENSRLVQIERSRNRLGGGRAIRLIRPGRSAQGDRLPALRSLHVRHLRDAFQHYLKRPPFGAEALRIEKLNRLNAIPGVSLPLDSIARRPSFPLESLMEEGRVEALLGVYEWVLEQILSV